MGRAAEQQQTSQRERIGVHNPLEAHEAGTEVLANGGWRDIDGDRFKRHQSRAKNRDQ
jgi:hypothetical protein